MKKIGKIALWFVLAGLALIFFSWVFGNWQMALALLIMIGIHEEGHLLVAKKCGIPTGGFFFLPIGGISLIKGYAQERWKDFLIAIGGPLAGFVLTAVLAGILFAFNIKNIFFWNVVFLYSLIHFFNFLPIFPLDGGRVFWTIGSSISSHYRRWLGQVISIFFIILFVLVTRAFVWGLILFYFNWQQVGVVKTIEAKFAKEGKEMINLTGFEIFKVFLIYLALIGGFVGIWIFRRWFLGV